MTAQPDPVAIEPDPQPTAAARELPGRCIQPSSRADGSGNTAAGFHSTESRVNASTWTNGWPGMGDKAYPPRAEEQGRHRPTVRGNADGLAM